MVVYDCIYDHCKDFILGGDASINNSKQRCVLLIIFVLYIFTVLWFTILKRSTGYHVAQFELFWSYKKWFAGDTELGQEIMANIAMFIPFGFLLSAILSPTRLSSRMRTIVVVSLALAFSLLIETLQLFLMRGLFEWDDLISNGTGAIIGVAIYGLLEKLLKDKKFSIVILSIGAVFTVTCLGVFIRGGGNIGVEADTTSRMYCFQVDSFSLQNGEIKLSGFTFRYEHADGEPTLTLRSKEDEVKLTTEYGLPRPDVNSYFLCDSDYTNCGFAAVGLVEPETEYEIFIRWPWSPEISTGVYIDSNGVHYSPSADFIAPDTADAPGLRKIVEKGTLRAYRPDYHCWVYQLGWSLYWITEPGFTFEDDGTTLIQYQMWTTQTDKLPEKRLAHGNLWDNISGHFETFEVEGDFGPYRVMRREIPTAYSVTSIVTGYYKNGEWIWKNYFRPVYEFGGGAE